MYCHKCGKEIDDEAVVCIHCGVKTKNFKEEDKEVNIVNQNSNSNDIRVPRVYSGVLDFFMIILTGGLWIIWMIVRPKYY